MIHLRVFLSAPLFNESERDFNSKIAKKLRENGFKVWLAQENPFIKEDTREEKNRIYKQDISALKESNILVAILDGISVDTGVAFEVGYADALGKPIIGLKTDYRTFSRMEKVNLILEVPMIKICENVDEVIDSLKKFC